jgi:hypothetical protein
MPVEPLIFRPDHHPVLRRRRAGGRRSGLACNLAEAQAAGPERREVIGHTQARNGNSGVLRRLIDGLTRRGTDNAIVDGQSQTSFLFFVVQLAPELS